MNRRSLLQGFALGVAGLLVPEPVRAYSFVGGWANASHDENEALYCEAGALRWRRRDGTVITLLPAADEGTRGTVQTIDGVPLVPVPLPTYAREFVIGQPVAGRNAVWTVHAGSWRRS